MSITSRADYLSQNLFCAVSSVDVDGLVVDELRVYHTRDHLSVESNGFLVELLRIADVTEGNLIERIVFILR